MRINHNIAALNTHRQLTGNNSAVQGSLEKLSSGLRINKAGDDAAGLAISEKMRGQIRGLEMASKNSQDGISLIQTAEGALTETHAILQRMRELTVQAGNEGTQESEDLQAIQDEINELTKEIDGISDRTAFNGKTLLDGTYAASGSGSLTFQIGANQGEQLTINIEDMSAEALTVGNASGGSAINVTSFAGDSGAAFDTALGLVDDAIASVSAERSKLGATQNRLEHTINNLGASQENLTAAESRIRDVDMAKEMMAFTKNNILTQASQSMLAQANQQPQGVLQLLQ
ncbi:flagellin Hag [Paraliobacillus ryukyuensis]|uniref:flagellin Hag n=1 Tax=Paraliobacillus ryukyuensis TaxID=200904 RepID=UPI0009A90270|nr:flagellin Hag [Paraliobacillus ryukyuensis]